MQLPTAVIHDPSLDVLVRLSENEEEALNGPTGENGPVAVSEDEEIAASAIRALLKRYESVAVVRQRAVARQVFIGLYQRSNQVGACCVA